jgi:hypothetical protein
MISLIGFFSSYHMQFAHGKGHSNDCSSTDFLSFQGVSAMTGRPFSPPLSYRTSSRRHALKLERSEILEGRCHKCKKWVPVESIKDCEVKV